MYTVTRKNRIREQLQLCHADGTEALVAEVDINTDKITGALMKRLQGMQEAQKTARENPQSEEALEALGNTIIALFEVIFGEEQTKQITDFYEGSYTEMLVDIFPFISNEILPKVVQASTERKNQLLAMRKRK